MMDGYTFVFSLRFPNDAKTRAFANFAFYGQFSLIFLHKMMD